MMPTYSCLDYYDKKKLSELISEHELKEKLNIPSADRIELFDNSNLFGSFNVSGMVVFKMGKPSKKLKKNLFISPSINRLESFVQLIRSAKRIIL